MALAGIFFVWAVLPVFLYKELKKHFASDFRNPDILILFSLACAPVFFALILRYLFMMAPGHSDGFYLISLAISIAPLLVKNLDSGVLGAVKDVRNSLKKNFQWVFTYGIVVFFGGCFCLIGVLFYILLLPALESDVLQYTAVSKFIYQAKDTSIYPVVEPLANGYYAISSHPLSFYMFSVYEHLLFGHTNFLIIKIVTIYYLFVTVLGISMTVRMLFGNLRIIHQRITFISVFLLLTTPIFFRVTIQSTIDVYRISFSIICFFIFVYIFRKNIKAIRIRQIILAGALLGCAISTHSLSLVLYVPTFVILIVYLQSKKLLDDKKYSLNLVMKGILIAVIASLVGGEQYIANLIRVGSPVSDILPLIRDVDHLDLFQWREAQRGLTTLYSKFFIQFSPFYKFSLFGIAGPLFLTSVFILLRARGKLRDQILRIRLLTVPVITYFVFGTALLMINNIQLVANFRYLLSPQIFICIVTASVFVLGFDRLPVLRQWIVPLDLHKSNFITSDVRSIRYMGPELFRELSKNRYVSQFIRKHFKVCVITLTILLSSWSLFPNLKTMLVHYSQHKHMLSALFEADTILMQSNKGRIEFIRKIDEILPLHSNTLTFRQNEFGYFLKKKFIRHYDPRLKDFYDAKDVKEALLALKALEITHIHVPKYSLVTKSNSFIGLILSSPHIVSLEANIGFQSLYKIKSYEEVTPSFVHKLRFYNGFGRDRYFTNPINNISEQKNMRSYVNDQLYSFGRKAYRLHIPQEALVNLYVYIKPIDEAFPMLLSQELKVQRIHLGNFYFTSGNAYPQGGIFDVPKGYDISNFMLESKSGALNLNNISLTFDEEVNGSALKTKSDSLQIACDFADKYSNQVFVFADNDQRPCVELSDFIDIDDVNITSQDKRSLIIKGIDFASNRLINLLNFEDKIIDFIAHYRRLTISTTITDIFEKSLILIYRDDNQSLVGKRCDFGKLQIGEMENSINSVSCDVFLPHLANPLAFILLDQNSNVEENTAFDAKTKSMLESDIFNVQISNYGR